MLAKTILGICSPYDWTETSLMATQLADYALRAEYTVSWFPVSFAPSEAPDDPGLHHSWDNRVQRAWQSLEKHGAYGSSGQNLTDMVWFVPRPDGEDFVSADAQHIAVLSADFVEGVKHDPNWPRGYDVIVCPSHALYDWAKKYDVRKALCLPWDTGHGYTDECPPRKWSGVRLLVVVDGPTASCIGADVLWTLRRLLYRISDLRVTLTSTSSWPGALRHEFQTLLRCYESRLLMTPRMSLFERRRAYRTHDWAWIPLASAASGAFVLESLAYGIAVAGFDAPPVSEFLVDGCHGAVMPCSAQPLAVGASPKFCAVDAASFLADRLAQRLCRHCLAPLETRLSSWQQTWEGILQRSVQEVVEPIL